MHGAARMNELYFNELKKDKNREIKKIKINYSNNLEEIGRLNFLKFLGIFIVLFKLLWKLTFFRPKVVYFEIALYGFAFFRDSLYVWLCKLFRKKIVFHLHAKFRKKSLNNELKKKYYLSVFKNTKVIILSRRLYEDIGEIIPKKNIEIIPNGIPDEISDIEFKEILRERKRNKKPILLFLSNMIESKGPLEVLKICQLLKQNGKDFECWFVGNWKERKTKKKFYNLVKKYNLKDKCKYLGPKYGEEKKEILKKTNFLIFPTKYEYETFGLVIIEAFMFGISVASYDTASIEEIIDKDYLGFVSKNKQPEEIFHWLEKNLYKKQEFKKIREEFKKKYLIKKSVAKLKKIIIRNGKKA